LDGCSHLTPEARFAHDTPCHCRPRSARDLGSIRRLPRSIQQDRGWLEGADAGQLAHGELEERLDVEGRELLRQMFQDHLDLRAQREPRLEAVVGANGVTRGSVEAATSADC
jgi:hypothetical protein